MIVCLIIFLFFIVYFIIVLIKNPNILSNTNGLLNTNSSSGPINVASADDPYKGGERAEIVIVEFGDFECPYCLQEFPVVREVINTYGDKIKFIFRDFPLLGDHPEAEKAAEAGECAHEQGKFWEMHDKMFINHLDLSVPALKNYAKQIGLDTGQFDDCLDSGQYEDEVLADLNDGMEAGVTGTPTFFINNQGYPGAIPLEDFKTLIDHELGRVSGS